jgi:hypothetical protein
MKKPRKTEAASREAKSTIGASVDGESMEPARSIRNHIAGVLPVRCRPVIFNACRGAGILKTAESLSKDGRNDFRRAGRQSCLGENSTAMSASY